MIETQADAPLHARIAATQLLVYRPRSSTRTRTPER